MTALDLDERGALADRLVPTAARLAGAVHDRDRHAVGVLLGRLPVQHRDALLVVLAAMIPADRTADELLAWVAEDTDLRTLAHAWPDATLRRLHSAAHAGRTDPVVDAGEREYQRRRKAAQRAKAVA